MGLTVHCDGRVVLTVPHIVPLQAGEDFLRTKTQWLLEKLAYYRQFTNTRLAALGRRDYLRAKEEARALVMDRLEYFNAHYGYVYNRVAIRNQKACWGSCSSKGNLNFNYKLLYIPRELCDYVIVHELCHLKEMNHSKRFWALVAETVLNYKELKSELKKIL